MYTSYAPPFARDINTTTEGIKFTMDSGKIPIAVIILADIFEDEWKFDPGSLAETFVEFDTEIYDNVATDASGKIISLRRRGFIINVQTRYVKDIDKDRRSGYGRGTTAKDRKSGNFSLDFHESQHSAEALEYIHKNQIPDMVIKPGMTAKRVQQILDDYAVKRDAYLKKLEAYHIAKVDCVGTPAKFCK